MCLNLSVPAFTRFSHRVDRAAFIKLLLSMNLNALYEKVRSRSLDGPRQTKFACLLDFGKFSSIR